MVPSYLNPKVRVFPSRIHKKGLFAKEPIKKDEVVAIPGGGYVVTKAQLDKYLQGLTKKRFKVLEDHLMKLAPGFYMIHSEKEKLYGDDYFNHSCNPNVGVKGNLLFVAMRDIRTGQELTYDYAMTDNDLGLYFKCRCGGKDCRKLITGQDWKNTSLQKKYKGYFAWHVEEAIKHHVSVPENRVV